MTTLKTMDAVRILATGEVGVVVMVDDSAEDEDYEGEPELNYKVAASETRWYSSDEVEAYVGRERL